MAAGKKVRCGSCKAVIVIPVPHEDVVEPEEEIAFIEVPDPKQNERMSKKRQTADDDDVEAGPGRPQEGMNVLEEAVEDPELVPGSRRRGPREKKKHRRSDFLRTAPGWRKVRLGLILLATSPVVQLWTSIAHATIVYWMAIHDRWTILSGYFVLAISLAGHVFCALVPLKGLARSLAIANLGVVALGLIMMTVMGLVCNWALTPVADLAQAEKIGRRLNKQPAVGDSESVKQETELRKQIAVLEKKQAEANDYQDRQEAAKQAKELRKRLAELKKKRAEEAAKATKQYLADLQADLQKHVSEMEAASTRTMFRFKLFLNISLLVSLLETIILPFFVRTIGPVLGVKDLASSCNRIALVAGVSFLLFLVVSFLPPGVALAVSVSLLCITIPFGLASFFWRELMLIDAAKATGDYLEQKAS
jgi:hypothetical protein